MARKKEGLKVLSPTPMGEQETDALLGAQNDQARDNGTIEAQAEQERREYEANSVPIADEPSTKKLVVTMGS